MNIYIPIANTITADLKKVDDKEMKAANRLNNNGGSLIVLSFH
jgi:hypothetical protein